MSRFKHDLLDAADGYQQQHYPGDLAADLRRKSHRRIRRWLAPSAIAAMIALMMWFARDVSPPAPTRVVTYKPNTQQPAHTLRKGSTTSKISLALSNMPSMGKARSPRLPRFTMGTMPSVRIGAISFRSIKYLKKEQKNDLTQPQKPDRRRDRDGHPGAWRGDDHRTGVRT